MIEIGEHMRLNGKTIVITGASSGIGKYTALDMFKRGGRVIMPCLDKTEGHDAAEFIKNATSSPKFKETGEIVVKEFDLSSLESVKACAEEILSEEPRIDILINNAGVFITDDQFSVDGYQIHFAVNYLGHFLFTMLLLPRILQSTPARIINTASIIHHLGKPLTRNELKEEIKSPTKAYAISKFAVVMFTKYLAKKLEGTGVNVYCLHPGIVDTPMAEKYLKSFNLFLRTLIKIAAYPIKKTAAEAAKAVLYCALDEQLICETGTYYSEGQKRYTALKTDDPILQKQLWDMTIELLDIEDVHFTS